MSSSPRIACRLTTPEQAHRVEELRNGLFARAMSVEERHNGYAFSFAGTESNASALLDFVGFERQCCPFLTFSLIWSPGPEPIVLSLTGDSSMIAFVRDTFVALTPTQPTGSFSS